MVIYLVPLTNSYDQPIRSEYGKGLRVNQYGKKIKYNRQPYSVPDQIYYGGDVQLMV